MSAGELPNDSTKDMSKAKGNALSHPSVRRQKRSVVGVLQAETLKERQARLKEAREHRRVRIGNEHKYILQLVADHIEMEPSALEEFILDTPQQMDMFDSFLAKDGARKLMFFVQEGDPPSHDTGRIVNVAKGTRIQTVFITNGTEERLTGKCLYFLRNRTNVQLIMRNLHEEITFGMLEVSSSGNAGVLDAVQKIFTKINKPAIHAWGEWGNLKRIPQGKKMQQSFLDSFDGFLQFLDGALVGVSAVVKLPETDSINLDLFSSAADCISAANNPETLTAVEDAVLLWCKQIEQVLAESDQMRKEADDTGPLAELEHWRFLNAKFNSILQQIKGKKCKTAISILHAAKSKVLKIWKALDCRITDAANEARDNVKYLYTLEKFCEPLYHHDLVAMKDSIQSLINAIRMVHSISRYYNTSERMTSLFIKVTNQMVTACKAYITDDGMCRIWDQQCQPLIEKLKVCIKLNADYQESFHKTKKKIEEMPGERPFDFSEMYIFGKFDAFCKRLEKIIAMLTTIETFTVLGESRIEGIDAMAAKFQNIYAGVKKKPYDILDHRKTDFDNDYEDFKRQINDLEYHLQCFMDNCFENTTSCILALHLLARFERLNISTLNIDEKYAVILQNFGNELDTIRKLYQKNKDEPPTPRDMPPVAGMISWARQL